MAINNFNVGVGTTSQLTRYRYVATGGETSVSGTDADGKTLSYTVGLEQVFLNGVNLVRGQDYTATNGTSVGALSALVASDVVEVFAFVPFNIANALTVSTVDAKGDLLAGTAADTVGRLAVGSNGQVLVADSTTATGLKWAGGGKVLQVLNAYTSSTFSTSSTSYVDVTSMSVTITPASSSSKFLLIYNTYHNASGGTNPEVTYIFDRGGTTFGDMVIRTQTSLPIGVTDIYLDSPATASSITYKVRLKVDTGTANNYNKSLVVMEIGA